MNDSEVSGWIRSLPRRTASPAFTSEVMRKVRPARPATPVWRLAVAFATIVLLFGIAHFAVLQQSERRRIAELRDEQRRIEAELQAVKNIASHAEPMVVLENDRGTRVIMDLESAIQPVSYRTYD